MIEEWITGIGEAGEDASQPPRATENDRHPLELYSQLTDDESLYVQELQRVYDESRCFFVQWFICKETKELVNSARISAIQQGKKLSWVHTRLEILNSLTDVTLTARFLALSRLKRQNGSTAKLWLSQVMPRRALLEDPKLPTHIRLPETLYLELTVGQLSAQETTVFDCPCIGDDLSEKDRAGNYAWTLDKLKRIVDQCSNPPAFRGVKTPITELLEQDPAKNPNRQNPRDKCSGPPDTKRKLNTRTTGENGQADKNGKRPPHERPAIFPKGLKRPDLTASADGHAIASEFQQKLYDDIVAGHCVRCHAKDHSRSTCKEQAGRWETKFDNEKEKYWTGTLKWQQKVAAEPASAKPKPPPTLVQKRVGFNESSEGKKKESRRQTLAFPDEDDAPLQCRAQSSHPYWGLKTPPEFDDDDSDRELSPAELCKAIAETTDMFCIDYSEDEAFQLLRSDPTFEVLRQTRYTSLVLLANGTHGVFFSCDVDEARASFQPGASADNTQDGQDGFTPLTTYDGSRLLTPTEITSLTAEVNTLVASLPVATQSTPLIPRAPWVTTDDTCSDSEADAAWERASGTLLPSNLASIKVSPTRSAESNPVYGPRNRHPYMRSSDWSTRYHAVADPPVLHESSSVEFLTISSYVVKQSCASQSVTWRREDKD
jgi:hypothetical protein